MKNIFCHKHLVVHVISFYLKHTMQKFQYYKLKMIFYGQVLPFSSGVKF